METVREFVDRTKGPMLTYQESWYPWVYAHHYLRLEIAQLPAELGVGQSLSTNDAEYLVRLWCAHTGENIESAARELANAYLSRWGLSPEPPAAEADRSAGPVPEQRREPVPWLGPPTRG